MHILYHPPFDPTAIQLHMSQQVNDVSIDLDMESDSSNNDDGIYIDFDTSDDCNKEHDSSDKDDTANKFQISDEEGEPPETFKTYLNHGVNDYNVIGRQEKLDEVFDTEKNYQQVSG